MSAPNWSTDDPTVPGIYWVVTEEHDRDVAEHDIFEMAHGWRRDPRPVPMVAEVCRDDDDPDAMVAFFVGTEEYPFEALHIDYKQLWWYGPLALPPSPPGHLPLRPLGESGLQPFDVPGTWPPEPGTG